MTMLVTILASTGTLIVSLIESLIALLTGQR